MKRLFNIDIILVGLLSVISLFSILIPSLYDFKGTSIIYVLLLIFLPGYSLLIVFTPKKDKLTLKIIMGVPVSIVILFLFSLVYSYIEINSKTLLLILAVITIVFSILGYIRRRKNSKKYEKRYIICKNCGGYYKLKKGESLSNFKVCQCGGKLEYVKNSFMFTTSSYNIHNKKNIAKKQDPIRYIICEKCGGHYKLKDRETLEDFETCHCGGKLNYAIKYFEPANLEKKSESKKSTELKKTKIQSKNSKYIPLDILLIWLFTSLCIIFVLTPVLASSAFRIIFGLISTLFIPGYSLIAALFPKKDDLDSIERTALSFGLSIAVTPLIGLLLNYTHFGIRLTPIVLCLSTFTIFMGVIAYIRRLKLYESERFNMDFRHHFNGIIKSFKRKSKIDKVLSITLTISIILAISATAYVIVVPKESEKFTEFYILGSNGTASNYPTNLTDGKTANITVGITNHEYSTVNYEMVIKLNNQTIHDTNITLSNNETYTKPFMFIPSSSRQNQELEFLLYKLPNKNNTYRSLHLWINVE